MKIIDFQLYILQIKQRRAISSIIGTMLLVMISSVGGSTVFMYSNDSLNSSQISNSPSVEYLKITGFDARDVEELLLEDGSEILAKNCCGIADGQKNYDERITIYVQNNSAHPVVMSELRLAGDVYYFTPATKIGEWNKIGNGHKPHPNEYIIINRHLDGKNYLTVDESSPTIQSGEIVTLLLDLGKSIPMYHDSQIKITTNNGNIFVSHLEIGEKRV